MNESNTDARKAATPEQIAFKYKNLKDWNVLELSGEIHLYCKSVLEFAQSHTATLDEVSDEELLHRYFSEFKIFDKINQHPSGLNFDKWRESLSEQPEAEKQLKITCPDCRGTGYEGGTVRLRGGSDCKTCKAFGKIDAPKPTEAEKVENPMIFWAFRYAIGRMSYVTSEVAGYIVQNWESIDKNTQSKIKSEIKEAISEERAGMSIDKNEWEKILSMPSTH